MVDPTLTGVYWVGMAATIAFAVTGVLAVSPRGIDFFGAGVMGVMTAIGGGTVRDLILGVPVFWSTDLNYVWVALVSSLLVFRVGALLSRHRVDTLMLYLDGLGAALFGIQAVDKTWNLNFALPVGPVMLGIITAIGGGLIRDMLAGRQTLVMSRELYAIPVMIGCTFYVLMLQFSPEHRDIGAAIGFAASFGLRAAAIHKSLRVPSWLATH